MPASHVGGRSRVSVSPTNVGQGRRAICALIAISRGLSRTYQTYRGSSALQGRYADYCHIRVLIILPAYNRYFVRDVPSSIVKGPSPEFLKQGLIPVGW